MNNYMVTDEEGKNLRSFSRAEEAIDYIMGFCEIMGLVANDELFFNPVNLCFGLITPSEKGDLLETLADYEQAHINDCTEREEGVYVRRL